MKKMVKREMKKGMLVKGKAAGTPKGMKHNVKVMEKAGYPKKRAIGTAYGEVGMEKRGRRDEAKGMYEAMLKKHEKADNKKFKKLASKRCK
jgi:hypothetical protein